VLVPVTLLVSGTVVQSSQHTPVTALNPGNDPQRFVLVSPVSQAVPPVTVAGQASVPVRVTGRDGIPTAGVSALAVHVSVTTTAKPGSAASPDGTVLVAPFAPTAPQRVGGALSAGAVRAPGAPPTPSAHLVAYHPGATTDGFALVGVGAAGALLVSNQGHSPVTVHLDVEGYVTGQGSAVGGGAIVPLAEPQVVASGRQMGAGQTAWLTAVGHGVPAKDAVGLLVDVTVRASGVGELRSVLAGAPTGAPLADYTPGATVTDLAVVNASDGRFGLRNVAGSPAVVSATLVGYLARTPTAAGGGMVTVTPSPVTSTPVRVAAGGTVSVPVEGSGGVPQAGVMAAAIGITATPVTGHTGFTGRALSVGLAGLGAAAPSGTECEASTGTCTGFTLSRLSSTVSGGAVAVHNYSSVPAMVSLDAFGYLTARTTPAAPTTVTATVKNGSATVVWRAPSADGGAALSAYTVAVSPGGSHIRVSGNVSKIVVPHVRGNIAYTFAVTAQNAVGSGPTAIGQLIPAGTPDTPGRVLAQRDGSAGVRVSWTPATPHGAHVTGYTVTASPGVAKAAVSRAGTSAELTHLAPGAVYVVCVTASSTTGATAQACAAPLRLTRPGTVVATHAGRPSNGSVRKAGPLALTGAPVTGAITSGVPGKCLDDASGVTTNGNKVDINGCNAGTTQTWTAEANGTIQFSGSCLDIASGTTIDLWACNSGANQVWESAANAELENPATGKCLDDPSASTTNGTQLNLVACAAGTAQEWRLPYNGLPVAGALTSGLAGKCLDDSGGGTADGNVVDINTCASTAAQHWTLEADGTVRALGKCLDITGSATAAGTKIQLFTCNAGSGQLWRPGPDGYLVNPHSSRCLDDPGSSTTNGTQLDLANCGGGTNQVWTLPATTVPGPPTSVMATAGNAQAAVSWVAPSANGGSAITGYTVTAAPGGATATASATATSATVTGLTNGTSYTFTVTATNGVGTSAASAPSAAVTPVGPPGAPTGVVASAGNAQATVTWTAPSNGGSAITSYTVTATPGGQTATATGTATSATVAGLVNGTSYTFTVTATNAAGTGPASTASTPVTPSGPPGAPTGVTATAGNAQATVSWTAPASTGGGSITSYTVTVSPGGATVSAAGTATSATVTSLTNGTSYTFTVTAVTAGGPGPASAPSSAVTPNTVPGAPTGVTATAGNSQASVSWTAPSSNGGSPITGYTVTASPGGATATASVTPTSATVTGLSNGTSYTFTVTATNAAGTGPASAASTAVTPTGPPPAPTITSVAPGNAQITVTWAAPSSNGGSPITGYTITVQPGGTTYSAAASATSALVTGLTNGTAYALTVAATNAMGTGTPSVGAGPVTPVGLPGAPANVTATESDITATVTWAPPSAYGSMVSGYTVTASPGGKSVTVAGTWTAATITGLTDGTSYTFTVTATDVAGTGPASAASNAVTPGPVPGPPMTAQATAGNASATVTWLAPTNSGGGAVANYTVTAVPGGATSTVTGTTTTVTVTGLTNGTAYRFTVTATNAYGTSPPSASTGPVTPTAPGAPDTPVITNVTARDSAIDVSWSPPDTGAANLTNYVITVNSNGSTVTTVNEPASATDAVVTGLANGTDYTFAVTAVNASGSGPASPATVAVAPRPAVAPMSPADVQAVPQNGQIQVAWFAPPDGGSPITGYTVSVSPADVASITTAGNTTVATVTGLTNGTAYTISVTATNAAGTSPAAHARPVTPAASIVPGAPGNLTATATGAGSTQLEWIPPESPGTSAITSYTITASTGGTTAATQSVPASACTGTPILCTATMSGLSSTTAYNFTVTATNSTGTSGASAATSPVTPNLVVKQAPVVLTAASVAALRQVGTEGTLYFEQPPVQVTGLKSGDLLKIPQVTAVPNGFLGRVTRVTAQGGLVAVSTARATLADEYSSYYQSLDVPINAASLQATSGLPGVILSRPTFRGGALGAHPSANPVAPNGAGISWTNGSLVLSVETDLLSGNSPQGEDANVQSGPMANISGSLTLTPHLKGSLSSPDASLNVSGTVAADLHAELGVHLAAQKKFLLTTIKDPEALPTPFGPQGVVFTIYAVLNTNGSVGVSFEASDEQTVGTQCTINIVIPNSSEDGCVGTHQDSGSGLTIKSALYGSMDVKAGLQFGISWQIEDVAGPQLTLTPWVDATVDTSANPWQDISVGASAGIDITALQECPFLMCIGGFTLFSRDNLINQKLFDIWNSQGPFQGLVLTPSVVNIGPSQTTTFTALTPAGQVSSTSVTWTVIAGQAAGTIDSSGNFSAVQNGTAVVEADYNGLTARAGVVVSPVVEAPQDDQAAPTRGLVNAVLASWVAPPSGSIAPVSYEVTAQAVVSPLAGGGNSVESTVVPYPETYAYLPNLAPGVAYSVTVMAVGADGTAVAGQPLTVFPLESLPGVTAGTGALQNVAINGLFPDKTGAAGIGGAAVSANGVYVFFLVEARSPLAPVSVFNPASTLYYVVRESLHSPNKTDLASVGPDGNPIWVNGPAGDTVGSSPDGSIVAFNTTRYGELVYDFNTNSTWSISPPANYSMLLIGLADDGAAVYEARPFGNSVYHVYRQVMGGAPQQIDKCTTTSGGGCGSSASMSSDGNIIAYSGPAGSGFGSTVSLYNATTGSSSNMFPANAANGDSLYDPVISGDGSHVAMQYSSANATVGLVIKRVDGSAVSPSDIVARYDNISAQDVPVALSDGGSVLVYSVWTFPTPGLDWFAVYSNGATKAAPSLSAIFPQTASLTADGSLLVYTSLSSAPAYRDHYPGVYAWQLRG